MKITTIKTELDGKFDFGPVLLKIEAQFEQLPCSLQVIVEFNNGSEEFRASVVFYDVEAFRVMDEGDQLHFLSPKSENPGTWLWKVYSGGWYEREVKSGDVAMLQTISDRLVEYFIVGEGQCVNVICVNGTEPVVTPIS